MIGIITTTGIVMLLAYLKARSAYRGMNQYI